MYRCCRRRRPNRKYFRARSTTSCMTVTPTWCTTSGFRYRRLGVACPSGDAGNTRPTRDAAAASGSWAPRRGGAVECRCWGDAWRPAARWRSSTTGRWRLCDDATGRDIASFRRCDSHLKFIREVSPLNNSLDWWSSQRFATQLRHVL